MPGNHPHDHSPSNSPPTPHASRLTQVACLGLSPRKHLARTIAQLEPLLLSLSDAYGCNVCGEGGEYETLTLDCAVFSRARLFLEAYEVRGESRQGHTPSKRAACSCDQQAGGSPFTNIWSRRLASVAQLGVRPCVFCLRLRQVVLGSGDVGHMRPTAFRLEPKPGWEGRELPSDVRFVPSDFMPSGEGEGELPSDTMM
jgi:hypothetical protein